MIDNIRSCFEWIIKSAEYGKIELEQREFADTKEYLTYIIKDAKEALELITKIEEEK